jgi:glycosyltransferase involved in cell wall biosynthesis
MKVAIISPITWPLPPDGYGPWENVTYNIASSLTSKGIEVTVYSTSETIADFKNKFFVEKTLKTEPSNANEKHLIHIVESIKDINENNFDIVHNLLGANVVAIANLLNKETKLLTTLHGFDDYSKFIYLKYSNQNYISISNQMRKECPGLNYTSTIYNGIDFEYFKLVEKKEDYFFIAARICREKGIHNAIKLALGTKTKLYIAGEIQDQDFYNSEVKPYIDNDLIFYLGSISKKEIKNYISKAKAYISLIEWDEPFGLSVAEAIACGTPVIATRLGSMIELVKENVSGILIDSTEEAIDRINEIGRISTFKCRQFGYNLFSLEKMTKNYINAYKLLINSN